MFPTFQVGNFMLPTKRDVCEASNMVDISDLRGKRLYDSLIALKPGESKVVSFTLRRADLLFIGRALKPTVEPGRFRLWIAPSAQAEGVAGEFTLA